jgi:hypothetical protein
LARALNAPAWFELETLGAAAQPKGSQTITPSGARHATQPLPTAARYAAVQALAGAAIVPAGVLGAIALLIEQATSTPWLPAEQAGLIAHCDAKTATTERRACVQAAVPWRDQTRLADARR